MREWIGGLLSPPFFIRDREEPYRAELVVWLELPSGLVVGQEAIDGRDSPGATARVLCAALERPAAGPPRRPDVIRVGNANLAGEVRTAIGDSIPVRIAPTPELEQLLQLMLETLPREPDKESYFEDGNVSEESVASLFAAARLLHHIAPWTTASDDQVLRLDIPELGVEGACVSIIGELGQSRGILIFPSLAAYEVFREAAGEPPAPARHRDFGTGWLALGLERAADLPESMRQEIATHGWLVAGADAHPRVQRYDSDGASPPLVDRDVEDATACSTSLCAFFVKHRALFEVEEFEPVCESFFDEQDLEVRFTYPYDAFPLFDVEDAPVSRRRAVAGPRREAVRRNDPCPCGSGRKYKKCHMSTDEGRRGADRLRDARHDVDGRLVSRLTRFAERRFGSEWRRFETTFVDALQAMQLSVPWSVYEYRVRGKSVLEWYFEERGGGLTREDRAWLAAQRDGWLSIWEVTEVDPGTSMTLRDLLSDEVRRVHEVSGSRDIVLRDTVLGRVVVSNDVPLLCGVHPRPLPPLVAAEVLQRARGRLRRKRAVPVERLRDPKLGAYLIRRWEEAVALLDARNAMPIDLRNTDGDSILLTTDHFEVAPGCRSAVESRLAAIDGVERRDDEEDGASTWVFLRPAGSHAMAENKVIGAVYVLETGLRLETNSRRRADALREQVEVACGEKVRHRAREHQDPQSSRAPRRGRGRVAHETSPEELEILREFKRRHYADWPDHALPALGGKTPREAVRTVSGRHAVDVLLKDMENREQRFAKGTPFDFDVIRRALRLE